VAENEAANDEIARTDAPESADRSVSSRKLVAEARKQARRVERDERRKSLASTPKRRVGGVRAVGTAIAVCALIAGVAIPAYAATQQGSEAAASATARDEAAQDAQSFAAGDEAEGADIAATSYSARTADEIAQVEAERIAVERAEEERARQAELALQYQQQQQSQGEPAGVQPEGTAPESPAAPTEAQNGWINPLGSAGYYISRSLSSGHDGTDMVTNSQEDWTVPIYAAKSGTVVVSSEAHYGWGVAVQIDHGDGTTTLYGHMTYGSRQVQAGEYVEQGQHIGYVGSTGRSTAHHLHVEVRVNGQLVEPRSYLPIG
jgi:murein DD-endopeptidase MepM/ murein hydrolase activator NlpD